MAKLDAFFKLMFDTGASDLHIVSASPRSCGCTASWSGSKYDPLDDEHLRQMLYEIAPEQKIKTFEETGDVDFGYEIPSVARFRANFFIPEERLRRRVPPDSDQDPHRRRAGPAAHPQEVRRCCTRAWCWSPGRPAPASPPRWPR